MKEKKKRRKKKKKKEKNPVSTCLHVEYLQLCTDRPVVLLYVVFIFVDYNPVFAKKPNSLSVRLK